MEEVTTLAYDFGGYVTKHDLRCSDGRVIRRGAFEAMDGKTVPLVWNHMHNEMDNILGHVELENRKDGVYGRVTLNETEMGRRARELVKNGDITAMSIYANQLNQVGSDVTHGVIREVSLVLSGANPGALIDNVYIKHSDDDIEEIEGEAVIYHGFDGIDQGDVVEHAAVEAPVRPAQAPTQSQARAEEESQSEDSDDPTIEDIVDTMNEDQKMAMYALIGAAIEGAQDAGSEEPPAEVGDDEETMSQSGMEEEDNMAHSNVFENNGAVAAEERTLQHDALTAEEIQEIFTEAKRVGSLKDVVIQHGFENLTVVNDDVLQHGVQQIDVLFPEVHNVTPTPATIKRPMEWVSGVLGGVQKSPFNRIKSMAFDLTEEEARARGYIKGKKKVEEQIKALKRTTTPQTVYKLQKLDRDDVIDITDFDIVAYLKSEMRMMLDEELARAVLVGDGRTAVDESKIKEDNIRPIWGDDDVYTIHNRRQTKPSTAEEINAFIDDIIRAHKEYKGSGQPTLFIGTDLLTEMRLLKDGDGYRRYKTDAELASDLRVSKIVEVQLLDGLKRQADGKEIEFGALIVNLRDYTMGATRGGQVTLFDDFDLNYNKMEYLIETRCCGALTQPASALAFEFGEAAD